MMQAIDRPELVNTRLLQDNRRLQMQLAEKTREADSLRRALRHYTQREAERYADHGKRAKNRVERMGEIVAAALIVSAAFAATYGAYTLCMLVL